MPRLDNLWISFGGEKSTDKNLKILSMPNRIAAAERGNAADVLGRDGDLWISDNSRKPIAMPVEMRMKRGASRTEVANWLRGGGLLVLGDDPDYFYRARVNGDAEFFRFVRNGEIWDVVNVEFSCQPFKYSFEGAEPLPDITSPALIENPGNVPSKPMITIYGSGDINLLVDEYSILASDVDGYITIDTDAMMAFKDSQNMSTKVTIVNDEDLWPEMKPGTNMINWSGTVSKIVMTPYWRWR